MLIKNKKYIHVYIYTCVHVNLKYIHVYMLIKCTHVQFECNVHTIFFHKIRKNCFSNKRNVSYVHSDFFLSLYMYTCKFMYNVIL